MDNFEIIKLNNEKDNILLVMKTSEPPLDFINNIKEVLSKMEYSGYVTIDEMLHSGNTGERFIQCFFNGNTFEDDSFKFITIEKHSKLRKYACELIRGDKESIHLNCLTDKQQKLIEQGYII